jgi:SAM-dependent methyltransferase
MPDQNIDEIYYAHGLKLPLAKRLTIHARERMFEHFMAVMAPGPDTRILDFGVSEAVTDESNALERRYPYPQNILCAGVGDGEAVRAAFPLVGRLSITPGAALPLADQSFDIAYSNAVLEHVGSDEMRAFIVRDLLRVARRFYFTVPNRWFPVEHHSGIPLLHYCPPLFRRLLKCTALAHWTDPRELAFLSASSVKTFMPEGVAWRSAYCGLVMGPFSSNLAVWGSL